MKVRRLVKEFEFAETVRDLLTLGANTRLNPVIHRLQLKEDDDGKYPTTSDLYVKTWVTNPMSLVQWLMFDARVEHAKIDGVTVTSVGFRLSDGTNEFWWNGASWIVSTSAWNTEDEVNTNIPTFPVTSKKLQIVINLKTTDSRVTPYVRIINVLFSCNIDFQEDLIYRSLVPALKQKIRPIADYPITLTANTTIIDMNNYPLQTPYNVADIDSVFNHTDDPDHFIDIFQSFDLPTLKITLTGAVAADKVVWIRFQYEPEVAVTTSQDYSEVEKVPSIILDDINLVDATESGYSQYVVDKQTAVAVKVPAPLRGDLEILAHIITDKGIGQTRLADAMKDFFANNPIIKSVGLDEEYRLQLLDDYDMRTAANRGDLHTGRLRFRLVGALFYMRDVIDTYGVKEFKTSYERI